jgi:hypothetical protein
MPHGIGVVIGVHAVGDLRLRDAGGVGDEMPYGLDGRVEPVDGGVDLRPVAGREDHALVDRVVIYELREGLPEAVRREGHLLEHGKRDGLVR